MNYNENIYNDYVLLQSETNLLQLLAMKVSKMYSFVVSKYP